MGSLPVKKSLLSPLDQYMPRMYSRVFLVFEVDDHDAAARRLGNGLTRLYRQLPYLRGRVSTVPNSGNRAEIMWSKDDAEPEWKELERPADMEASYQALAAARAPLERFNDAASIYGMFPAETDAPVFAASYIRLEGGLVVCFCLHHAVMDGGGHEHMARLWAVLSAANTDAEAEAAAAVISQADPDEPLDRLARLRDVSGSAEFAHLSCEELVSRHAEWQFTPPPDPSAPAGANGEPALVPDGVARIFRFSVAKLTEARTALSERGLGSPGQLTTNNLLTALFWSFLARIRLAKWQVEAVPVPIPDVGRHGFALNGRSRLGLAPGEYLGNVNIVALAEAPRAALEAAARCRHGALADDGGALEGLADVVVALATAAARVTRSHIAELLELIHQVPGINDIVPTWHIFGDRSLDLTATSWANQDWYTFNFGDGVGSPKFVRNPFFPIDGHTTVLPRWRGDEKEIIEVAMFLNRADAETIDRDEVWQSWS
ncbi:hypothetical protein GQ53DRAFT_837025 [Thozetella sp. PMI_491]|nr:hypothetical protein GQ53DRAFT_837025 [Thozetella sp. PMI_491]